MTPWNFGFGKLITSLTIETSSMNGLPTLRQMLDFDYDLNLAIQRRFRIIEMRAKFRIDEIYEEIAQKKKDELLTERLNRQLWRLVAKEYYNCPLELIEIIKSYLPSDELLFSETVTSIQNPSKMVRRTRHAHSRYENKHKIYLSKGKYNHAVGRHYRPFDRRRWQI